MRSCKSSQNLPWCEGININRLGTFYNATPGNEGKEKVKEWASKAYPKVYEDLLRVGQYTVSQLDEEGKEQSYLPSETLFNIDPLGRSVEP